MKIRTLIGIIIVAVVILAICVTSSLFVIRCTNGKKTQTYQNMKLSDAGLNPASLVTGGYTMDITNPQLSVNYIKEVNGKLLYPKLLDITGWDMDTDATHVVPHGVGALFNHIISVSGHIFDDAMSGSYPITPGYPNLATAFQEVNIIVINNTNISLSRRAGGLFDGITFNDAVMKRGDLLIWFYV